MTIRSSALPPSTSTWSWAGPLRTEVNTAVPACRTPTRYRAGASDLNSVCTLTVVSPVTAKLKVGYITPTMIFPALPIFSYCEHECLCLHACNVYDHVQPVS